MIFKIISYLHSRRDSENRKYLNGLGLGLGGWFSPNDIIAADCGVYPVTGCRGSWGHGFGVDIRHAHVSRASKTT